MTITNLAIQKRRIVELQDIFKGKNALVRYASLNWCDRFVVEVDSIDYKLLNKLEDSGFFIDSIWPRPWDMFLIINAVTPEKTKCQQKKGLSV